MYQNIQNIKEIQFLLLEKVDLAFKRHIYDDIDFSQRLIGLVGPRGVGKTTLILQYIKEKYAGSEKALYFAADNVLFKKGDLFEFAREFYLKQGGRLLCVDEIHRYPDWNQELKNTYDAFPELKIIFSGSSSLDLVKGQYDLSRRGVIYKLSGLSFREYLAFSQNIIFESFTFKHLIDHYQEIAKNIASENDILKHFNDYLLSGYYPFWMETKNLKLYYLQINNTIDKAVYEDIGSFYKLKTENLIVFKNILAFLAGITPGSFSVNKLASSLGKNHATISEYLKILAEAGLIRFLAKGKGGHAQIRRAEKVFLDNTNLAAALGEALGLVPEIGTQRELFALNQLQAGGNMPVYTEKGDLAVDNYILEIGGRNKSFSQIGRDRNSFLVLDDILVADHRKIPLYLLGFLY
jgi:uncharacterized protein